MRGFDNNCASDLRDNERKSSALLLKKPLIVAGFDFLITEYSSTNFSAKLMN